MPKTSGRKRVVGIKWMSKTALKSVMDSRARRVLGISGADFAEQYSKGSLRPKSLDRTAGTVELAALCSFTRKRSASKKRKSR